jgi:glycosyltransferase involved in cell wall biosynthesis
VELFESHGATVIRNKGNVCYACAQNQGVDKAESPFVAFLNNDIFLSKNWDKKMIEHMQAYKLDAISPCGIETMETSDRTRKAMRRWRRINALQRLRVTAGIRYTSQTLKKMIRTMYGNWDTFTQKRCLAFDNFLSPGISGNCVIIKKSTLNKIGNWNTAVAASDWDLQLRLVKRQQELADVKQCMIAHDVFVHHFIRATFRTVKNIRACGHAPREIGDAYTAQDLVYLNRPAISLIIAVHNKPEFLERTFASLRNQTIKDFEIVIADDGSGKSIPEMILKWNSTFSFPIVHVWQEHKGFRKTIIANKAVERSRSEYLCFIDGDCILHHRFLADHMSSRHVGTVLSGRRVMLDGNLTQQITLADISSRRIEKPSFWLGNAQKSSIKHGVRLPAVAFIEDAWRRTKNYCILGSNFSVYKGDFYRVNGYEEAIIGRGLEDNNLSNRFKRAGIRIRTVARKAIQYHQFHSFDPVPHGQEIIDRWGAPQNYFAEKGLRQES